MIVLRRLLTLVVTLAFGVGVIALAPASAQERHIEASLAFESRTPKPGESVTPATRMKPESGWHGYWTNACAAGLRAEADRRALPSIMRISCCLLFLYKIIEVHGIVRQHIPSEQSDPE